MMNIDRYSRVQKFLSSMFQMFIKVDILNIETTGWLKSFESKNERMCIF